MAINYSAELQPGGEFPLLDIDNIRGGFRSVETLLILLNIPSNFIKDGMICLVNENQTFYKYINGQWNELDIKGNSIGIPILTKQMVDDLGDKIPDKYINIPDDTDLDGQVTNKTYTTTNNGNYLDILFSAIRSLQSEVARIRNSFLYGMYSYTGKNTAMSRIVNGIKNPDDEPLWAIDEEDLSLINSMVIGLGHTLEPIENVNIDTEGLLKLKGKVTWKDDDTLKNLEDPKLFCYSTLSNLNINFNFKGLTNKILYLNKLDIPLVDIYNVMLLINRLKDLNYIYISIGNATRDLILKEGFMSKDFTHINDYKTLIDEPLYIESINFLDLNLSKLNFYSKYQDFSHQVIPSAPTDEDYKYKVAHITIRSVKSVEILEEIKNQLPENELIFVENNKKLYIKNNNSIIAIGGSGGETSDGMTESEIILLLKNMGIVKEDGLNLQITDLSDITFIHQDTGQRFQFYVDSTGNLRSLKLPNKGETLAERITNSGVQLKENVRGFIGQLRIAENNKNVENVLIEITQDARLFADRVKIGAFYAPLKGDKVFGCNRAFVELENTADCDFNLNGCYLHYTCPNNIDELVVYHLPLKGTLYAGSTYLIVGKEYSNILDSSTMIKVKSFDLEWFVNGQLIDFTVNTNSENGGWGFALTYGNENLEAKQYLYKKADSASLSALGISSNSKFPFIYDPSFIDAIYFYKDVKDASGKGYWASMTLPIKSNTMYKNTFELDPAKQAFQSCNTTDSSRNRWKSANDTWVMDLSKPTITFPHTEDTYPLVKFSPKASFEHRNVQTDKSKLDMNKPNMVNCAFGVNLHTDRSFNWISAGVYDEYIWLRKKGEPTWSHAFESYRLVESAISKPSGPYPARKEFSKELNNAAYARIIGRFPADGTLYTSHKCIIKIAETAPTQPETWEYIVGRRNKIGGPDLNHTSEIFQFTLYPETYKPVIYLTTDQLGFQWLEYLVWAAAAKKLYEKIKEDLSKANIIPIIINTGDMTLNGTRISEWYDYYLGGYSLFKEFEHNAVVGNNDLCNTDINALGTGDDLGKSNSFYFHVCYCYDTEESIFVPLVNNVYIPSLYYFESKNFRFINVNSEITVVNCALWFNLMDGLDVVNIYTGFTIGNLKKYIKTFTPIYTMLFNMLNTTKKCIVACHEMPFTVITNESISNGLEGTSRSLSKANALVGSHLNQISSTDVGKGIYWFSRLLEFKKVKLVIGGHKHTYSCTYPVREYFQFNGNKNSKDNYEEYTMTNTLENDNVTWLSEGKDLTKFPLTKREDVGSALTGFYPYTPVPNLQGGVTYFMCQATGYKLTSNKELPSANLKFSLAVPQTSNSGGKDTANPNLKYPMFGVITLDDNSYKVQLIRVANIFDSSFKFTLNNYSTEPMKLQYFKNVPENNYGLWLDTEETLITL